MTNKNKNIEIHGWEFYDLEKKMKNKNLSQMLELYKETNQAYKNKCVEYVSISPDKREELEKECNFLSNCVYKVAYSIANMLTE